MRVISLQPSASSCHGCMSVGCLLFLVLILALKLVLVLVPFGRCNATSLSSQLVYTFNTEIAKNGTKRC